jgi:uncharacterized membrane protein
MTWIFFAFGAALSWGFYGPVLHKGQTQLGNPLKALLCVGMAYFLVGVLVPAMALGSQGQLKGFGSAGVISSTLGGALGALGAVCIIWAFRNGGSPMYVMPIVFGLAPLINVLYTAIMHPPKNSPSPLLYLGYLLASIGVGLVLRFRPS